MQIFPIPNILGNGKGWIPKILGIEFLKLPYMAILKIPIPNILGIEFPIPNILGIESVAKVEIWCSQMNHSVLLYGIINTKK